MSIKFKAIRRTAGMFALLFLIFAVLAAITSLSAEVVGMILISILLICLFWIVYEINLTNLIREDEERY